MSNQALQTMNTQSVVSSFSQTELDTLKATIARGTTNEQFALFVQTCARSGLNPFLNQIHCIVYNSEKHGPQMSIQIAVEGIVALAKRHPQYKGFVAAEIRKNDHFKAKMHSGEIEHEPDVMNPGETIGAYCVAYRDDAPNMLVIVRRDQVEHLLKGRNSQMWKDYFDDMIVKHAIKRAFKRQFGIEVAEDEQIGAADNIPAYEPPARRDITAEANAASAAEQLQPPPPKPEDEEAKKMADARKQMSAKFKQLGITDTEKMSEYIAVNCKMKGDKPTLAEMLGLLKIMDMHIEEKKAAAGNDDNLPDDPLA
ncbi:RecT family recombinase [Paenibacillus contaminans]|uniref:RecT protein n=1 Tax=Paenibacillus contaminans TaxID=450362 RepID=A0A329MGW3_9BACL|nr:RecT family recombinase [Paenibacillus contaminans]RAV18858.1 RecT protein [Paenibacillus contaminans]